MPGIVVVGCTMLQSLSSSSSIQSGNVIGSGLSETSAFSLSRAAGFRASRTNSSARSASLRVSAPPIGSTSKRSCTSALNLSVPAPSEHPAAALYVLALDGRASDDQGVVRTGMSIPSSRHRMATTMPPCWPRLRRTASRSLSISE